MIIGEGASNPIRMKSSIVLFEIEIIYKHIQSFILKFHRLEIVWRIVYHCTHFCFFLGGEHSESLGIAANNIQVTGIYSESHKNRTEPHTIHRESHKNSTESHTIHREIHIESHKTQGDTHKITYVSYILKIRYNLTTILQEQNP